MSTAILVLFGVAAVVIGYFGGVRELGLISGAVIVGLADRVPQCDHRRQGSHGVPRCDHRMQGSHGFASAPPRRIVFGLVVCAGACVAMAIRGCDTAVEMTARNRLRGGA